MKASEAVWITPIITRASDGGEIPELGVGGGGGDLEPAHHIDLGDSVSAIELMKLCSEKIVDARERADTLSLISKAMASDVKAVLLEGFDSVEELEDMPLDKVTALLQDIAAGKFSRRASGEGVSENGGSDEQRGRSRKIVSAAQYAELYIHLLTLQTFPYSRHSSYEELCDLVKIFKPMDIYPCTVDEMSWDKNVGMETLFGHLCSGNIFTHDIEMNVLLESRAAYRGKKRPLDNSQDMQTSDAGDDDDRSSSGSTQASVKDRGQPKIELIRASVTKRPRKTCDAKEQKAPEHTPVGVQTITTTSPTTSDERRVRAIRTSFDTRLDRNTAISPSDGRDGPAEVFESSLPNGITHKLSVHETKAQVSIPCRRDNLNAYEYHCQWLACCRLFPVLSQLHHHVLSEHLIGTRRNGATRFGCMWTSCRSLGTIEFPSEEAWEEHMNSQHYDSGESQPDPLLDMLAQSGTESKLRSSSTVNHATHLELQRGYVSPQPGATQNQPIELSDGSDSDEASSADLASILDGESQLSVSDSAFASQHATNLPRQLPQGRIFKRKEAYKAAIGRGDLDWATYSPFPSSNTEAKQEVELG